MEMKVCVGGLLLNPRNTRNIRKAQSGSSATAALVPVTSEGEKAGASHLLCP